MLVFEGLGRFKEMLGRRTANSRLTPVVAGNMLAGFALFGLSWRMVLSNGRGACGIDR